MDWNRVEGNWKQIKGKVKEKWGRLTDDELDKIAGKRDQLEGKIQERYGIAKDQARKDIEGGGVYLNNVREANFQRLVSAKDLLFGKYLLLRKGKRNYMVVKTRV